MRPRKHTGTVYNKAGAMFSSFFTTKDAPIQQISSLFGRSQKATPLETDTTELVKHVEAQVGDRDLLILRNKCACGSTQSAVLSAALAQQSIGLHPDALSAYSTFLQTPGADTSLHVFEFIRSPYCKLQSDSPVIIKQIAGQKHSLTTAEAQTLKLQPIPVQQKTEPVKRTKQRVKVDTTVVKPSRAKSVVRERPQKRENDDGSQEVKTVQQRAKSVTRERPKKQEKPATYASQDAGYVCSTKTPGLKIAGLMPQQKPSAAASKHANVNVVGVTTQQADVNEDAQYAKELKRQNVLLKEQQSLLKQLEQQKQSQAPKPETKKQPAASVPTKVKVVGVTTQGGNTNDDAEYMKELKRQNALLKEKQSLQKQLEQQKDAKNSELKTKIPSNLATRKTAAAKKSHDGNLLQNHIEIVNSSIMSRYKTKEPSSPKLKYKLRR